MTYHPKNPYVYAPGGNPVSLPDMNVLAPMLFGPRGNRKTIEQWRELNPEPMGWTPAYLTKQTGYWPAPQVSMPAAQPAASLATAPLTEMLHQWLQRPQNPQLADILRPLLSRP